MISIVSPEDRRQIYLSTITTWYERAKVIQEKREMSAIVIHVLWVSQYHHVSMSSIDFWFEMINAWIWSSPRYFTMIMRSKEVLVFVHSNMSLRLGVDAVFKIFWDKPQDHQLIQCSFHELKKSYRFISCALFHTSQPFSWSSGLDLESRMLILSPWPVMVRTPWQDFVILTRNWTI